MKRALFILTGFIALCIGAMFVADGIPPLGGRSAASPVAAAADLPQSPIRRCMNMGGALEAPTEGAWGYTIQQADFRRLKQAGFDTVRVPIRFSVHTAPQPPYAIDRAFLARIDQVVDAALTEGLQIIIDVHHYEALMRHPDQHEARLEAIWSQLSYHYAKAPPQLIFELLNEPNDRMTVARTDALNARLLQIVRQHNPQRWVIVGSAGWGSLDALMDSHPPQDPGIIMTFHYYAPFEFTHQGADWVGEDLPLGVTWGDSDGYRAIARHMDEVKQWAAVRKLPLFLGEFGVINKADHRSRALWTEAVRLQAERNNMGWCYWDYATAFHAYDQNQQRWLPDMRKALTGR